MELKKIEEMAEDPDITIEEMARKLKKRPEQVIQMLEELEERKDITLWEPEINEEAQKEMQEKLVEMGYAIPEDELIKVEIAPTAYDYYYGTFEKDGTGYVCLTSKRIWDTKVELDGESDWHKALEQKFDGALNHIKKGICTIEDYDEEQLKKLCEKNKFEHNELVEQTAEQVL